jgi:hypothetical protein
MGYGLVLLNDITTATQMVYTKQKLNEKYLGKYGVMYYNSFLICLPTMVLTYCTGELEKVCAALERKQN